MKPKELTLRGLILGADQDDLHSPWLGLIGFVGMIVLLFGWNAA
jgi:hypothetical protein